MLQVSDPPESTPTKVPPSKSPAPLLPGSVNPWLQATKSASYTKFPDTSASPVNSTAPSAYLAKSPWAWCTENTDVSSRTIAVVHPA